MQAQRRRVSTNDGHLTPGIDGRFTSVTVDSPPALTISLYLLRLRRQRAKGVLREFRE